MLTVDITVTETDIQGNCFLGRQVHILEFSECCHWLIKSWSS